MILLLVAGRKLRGIDDSRTRKTLLTTAMRRTWESRQHNRSGLLGVCALCALAIAGALASLMPLSATPYVRLLIFGVLQYFVTRVLIILVLRRSLLNELSAILRDCGRCGECGYLPGNAAITGCPECGRRRDVVF